MALFIYNIFLFLYKTGIRIASLWDRKAQHWIEGRKNIFDRMDADLKAVDARVIWFHCSSLGEFEQGRPVMEKLRHQYPNSKFLLTFFSPSGYEIRKDYKGADWVYYLPPDSKKNANRFFNIVKPSLVVFVKYDYWYYYLTECKRRNTPLLMISAIFRKEQTFFRWYGGMHREMLKCFTHFFVQDNGSLQLLKSAEVTNATVSGDTRFDRVAEIADNFKPIEQIEMFAGNSAVLVAGSTWPGDERIIKNITPGLPELKLIIAPHEIHKEHLEQLRSMFPDAIFFSQLKTSSQLPVTSTCIIIDNIGMLARLYHYATITYIGGGFDKGIHNTLEAAVYGKPVLFGPNYKKFREATGLIETGGGICVNPDAALAPILKDLLTNKKELEQRSKASFDFVRDNRGATDKILQFIQENRLLTN